MRQTRKGCHSWVHRTALSASRHGRSPRVLACHGLLVVQRVARRLRRSPPPRGRRRRRPPPPRRTSRRRSSGRVAPTTLQKVPAVRARCRDGRGSRHGRSSQQSPADDPGRGVDRQTQPERQPVRSLNSGQFTVFAPDRRAFARLDPATIDKLKTDSALADLDPDLPRGVRRAQPRPQLSATQDGSRRERHGDRRATT